MSKSNILSPELLSKDSLVLVICGALRIPGNYLLDIGVSEDVAFHLGLSKQF